MVLSQSVNELVSQSVGQTEFKVHTVSYGSFFFLFDLWPKRRACGPKLEGEKQGPHIDLVIK